MGLNDSYTPLPVIVWLDEKAGPISRKNYKERKKDVRRKLILNLILFPFFSKFPNQWFPNPLTFGDIFRTTIVNKRTLSIGIQNTNWKLKKTQQIRNDLQKPIYISFPQPHSNF